MGKAIGIRPQLADPNGYRGSDKTPDMPQCPECGERLSLIDETTKLIEYRCSNCYHKEIEWKNRDE